MKLGDEGRNLIPGYVAFADIAMTRRRNSANTAITRRHNSADIATTRWRNYVQINEDRRRKKRDLQSQHEFKPRRGKNHTQCRTISKHIEKLLRIGKNVPMRLILRAY